MKAFWKKYRRVILLILGIILLIFVLAGIQTCHQINQIEKKVGNKIEQVTTPPIVIVEKYDSATQVRIITIRVDQKIAHGRIDSLSGAQLQFTLDSVFNRPARHPANP